MNFYGDLFQIFFALPSHNIWTLWSSKGFFSCMKISTHCTYFMTSLPIVNHIGIVNVEPMWDIDISDTPKRFVHSSRTQIFEFPVNRSDFRHHAMRDTWRLNYNHRHTLYGQENVCEISRYEITFTWIPNQLILIRQIKSEWVQKLWHKTQRFPFPVSFM